MARISKKPKKSKKPSATTLRRIAQRPATRIVEPDYSVSVAREILKKQSKSVRSKRLEAYTWGFGLEHETQFFHIPFPMVKKPKNFTGNIKNFTLYNTQDPVLKVLSKFNEYSSEYVSPMNKDFLEKTPYEPTGRRCQKQWVLKKVPIEMPEFITSNPFSNIKTGKRTMEDYCKELVNLEKRYVYLMMLNGGAKKLINKYGALSPFPYGMSNYIRVPKRSISGKYQYHNALWEDYTGSYHVTITLPFIPKNDHNYSKKETEKFIKMHENFANQFQWLEPLLLTGFFSCDQKAVGTKEKRVRGSFRVMRVGWGNLAGTDVRKFKSGIGRYSNIKSKWREGLDFHDLGKLDYCKKVTVKEQGAISALSSDFRTFGSTDPKRPWHRESGAGMHIPNGIEIRIFDHFNSKYIKELCRFIAYVAANSHRHKADKYVYNSASWNTATREIMKHGWRAILSNDYVKMLSRTLGLTLKPKTMMAYDILLEVNDKLYAKNKDDDWIFLMLENATKPVIPNINRRSWEYAFTLALNRDESLRKRFNRFLKEIPTSRTPVKEFDKLLFKHLPKPNWKDNVVDIYHYLKQKGIIHCDGKTFMLRNKNRIIMDYLDLELLMEWFTPVMSSKILPMFPKAYVNYKKNLR